MNIELQRRVTWKLAKLLYNKIDGWNGYNKNMKSQLLLAENMLKDYKELTKFAQDEGYY